MEPSPSMVHLAMAAFFGASLMAISALFIHKRSVDQILERLIEVRRRKVVYRDTRLMDGEVEEVAVVEEEEEEELGVEDYGGDGNEGFNLQDDDEEEEREVRGQVWGVPSKSGVEENLDMNLIPSYGISSSVPNFGKFSNDWVEDDSNIHGLSSSLDKSHLPLLHRYLRNADGCSSVPLGDTVTSNGQAKELNNGDPISSQENNSPSIELELADLVAVELAACQID
uniref:Transmembrane protein n=1 Tax=Chenopodium quinoa TaxID=63459 RepID=A0A803MB09_CHEQI